MADTLIDRKTAYQLIMRFNALEKLLHDIRTNQTQKLQFVDITIDGTGNNGILTIGSIYMKVKSASQIGFYRVSDNTCIASLDTSGNLKLLGSLTQNTTP